MSTYAAGMLGQKPTVKQEAVKDPRQMNRKELESEVFALRKKIDRLRQANGNQ